MIIPLMLDIKKMINIKVIMITMEAMRTRMMSNTYLIFVIFLHGQNF